MSSLFKINPKKNNIVIFFTHAMFIFFALLVVFKLIELQIIDPHHLKEKAKRMRQEKTFTFRGEITDRYGVKLATDTTLYDIYAHPRYYKSSPQNIATLISPYLDIPKDELVKKLSKNYSTISVAKGIERNKILKIKKFEIEGLDLVKRNVRLYPQKTLASHILGYVNSDANISAGVEYTGNKNLKKTVKSKAIEKTAHGEVIFDFTTDPRQVTKPVKGNKLTLTIDSSIQHIAETELAKMIDKTEADRGTVIVMNPNNGEILAFAVLPSYNPNEYNKFEQSVVKNWALSDVYPPGSTFKVLTVASALENQKITKDIEVMDTGRIKIQGWTIENYDVRKHPKPGMIDLAYLFEHSSNIGSLKIALKMTAEEFYNQLVKFGIGSKTGIDLPGESAGILPHTDTWDEIRQATIGFGYSIASTPVQIASAIASVANGGYLITPHVIKYKRKDLKKHVKFKKVISPETANTISEILEQSIRNSKSEAGKVPNFSVAGKSGTSRKPNPNGPGYIKNQVYTSFVGFLPAKKPEVLIMVVVDNPKGYGVWGSTVAGPVFNEVALQITRHLKLRPDAPGLNVKKK